MAWREGVEVRGRRHNALQEKLCGVSLHSGAALRGAAEREALLLPAMLGLGED